MSEPRQDDATAPHTSITLNGRKVAVRRHVLPYADICRLADRGPEHRPTVTVAYPTPSLLRDMAIEPGMYAEVRAGMVINVGLTGRA